MLTHRKTVRRKKKQKNSTRQKLWKYVNLGQINWIDENNSELREKTLSAHVYIKIFETCENSSEKEKGEIREIRITIMKNLDCLNVKTTETNTIATCTLLD